MTLSIDYGHRSFFISTNSKFDFPLLCKAKFFNLRYIGLLGHYYEVFRVEFDSLGVDILISGKF